MHLKTDTGINSHYANVPRISHARNSFSIAETHKTTMKFDLLYPLWHKFIYPGDTVSIDHAVMTRLSTQITDLFDDLYIDVHAWFVPHRLVHTNWARFQFNTKETITQDNTGLTTPAINFKLFNPEPITGNIRFPAKSIWDYYGYPTQAKLQFYGSYTAEHMNNYLARGYALIYNTNYRDQNLQNPTHLDLGDGPDDPRNYYLLFRGKRHDQWTSALPFSQKGAFPGGAVSIIGSAPVTSTGQQPTFSGPSSPNGNLVWSNTKGLNLSGATPADGAALWFGSTSGLQTNLTAGFAYMMINDLRLSASVQQLFEADARGGTRDVESILNRWGVTVPDFRMQRPEYLGGSTFTFDGHVVPSTVATDDNPQGHLTSFSQAMNRFHLTHSFVEHGTLQIFVSARSNLTYQQGLPKELSYKTRFDFYQPEFAQLGEQGIKQKEVNFISDPVENQITFGYQEYGYELRYGLNRVSAEMRSSYPQSLDSKHMAVDWGDFPIVLNAGFIQSFTPIARNIVVDPLVADPIQINQFVKGTIARTLPMYSVPGITRV